MKSIAARYGGRQSVEDRSPIAW